MTSDYLIEIMLVVALLLVGLYLTIQDMRNDKKNKRAVPAP